MMTPPEEKTAPGARLTSKYERIEVEIQGGAEGRFETRWMGRIREELLEYAAIDP